MSLSCVISTMCDPRMEFQRLNPSTQVALFALCTENCSDLQEINWKIYRGSINPTEWILFNQTDQLLFGKSLFFFSLSPQSIVTRSKERRRVTSQQQLIFSRRIATLFAGNSKLFIPLPELTVQVR